MEKLTIKAAAKLMNVSERSVYYAYARRIARERPDLIQACECGEMSLHAAIRIIDGPKPVDRYANLVKAWNAASDDDRRRLPIAAELIDDEGEPPPRATRTPSAMPGSHCWRRL
jgi:hypothetical protein